MELPNSIQIINPVEIYIRGNVLFLHYAGTREAMYKYSGAIFGISANRARLALQEGDALAYPNSANIKISI